MKRWLYTYRALNGSVEDVENRLREHLPALLTEGAAGERPAPDGAASVVLDTQVAGMTPTKRTRVTTGVAKRIRERVVIPLRWHAQPGRAAFPAFEGTLEISPLSSRTTQLTLVGSYTTPFGPIGAVADAAGLHTLAHRTADRLLDRLVEGLRGLGPVVLEARPDPGPKASLRVRDVMTADPVTLAPEMPLRTAALLFVHNGISGAPVMTDDGELLGVLSERDLLEKEATPLTGAGRRAAVSERLRTALTVGEACSRPARVTVADAALADAARLMLDHGVARLVVVDANRVVGILSRRDVLRALLRTDAELQTLVDEVLTDLGEPRVHARVDWGQAMVVGTATRASRVPGIVSRLEAIDGIVAVDEDLDYEVDDVWPMPLAGPIV